MNSTSVVFPESSAQQLTLAAHKAFLQEGALPISYGPVAELAGVSRALVYTHFPTPEDLINSVLNWQIDILTTSGLLPPKVDGDFKAKVMACLKLYFEHLFAHGPLLHVVSQNFYMGGKLSNQYTQVRNGTLKFFAKHAAKELRLRPRAAMSFIILVASLAEEGARLARTGTTTAQTSWASVRMSAETMIDSLQPE